MKKKIFALLIVGILSCGTLTFTACTTSDNMTSSTGEQETVKEYVAESEIPNVFSNPEEYKGKYIKLTGQIFNGLEVDGDYAAYQAWHNFEDSDQDFVVLTDNSTLKQNSYISVDGEISDVFEGENMLGATITCPLINADSVEEMSYVDAVVPTISSLEPTDAAQVQHDIELKVDKIEFAEKETRVYFTETNNSDYKFSLYTYSMNVVQNGKQFEQDYTSDSIYSGNYPELSSDLMPGASSSGIVVFPALDNSMDFQITAEGSSDNYEIEFDPFIFEIKAE